VVRTGATSPTTAEIDHADECAELVIGIVLVVLIIALLVALYTIAKRDDWWL
jgi:hypothetical protein